MSKIKEGLPNDNRLVLTKGEFYFRLCEHNNGIFRSYDTGKEMKGDVEEWWYPEELTTLESKNKELEKQLEIQKSTMIDKDMDKENLELERDELRMIVSNLPNTAKENAKKLASLEAENVKIQAKAYNATDKHQRALEEIENLQKQLEEVKEHIYHRICEELIETLKRIRHE